MDLATIVQTQQWQRLTSILTSGEIIIDRSVEPCDLSQECYLGLHSASQRYESDRGASLLTFARSWMRQRIRRTARNTTIGIPTRFRDSIRDRPALPLVESATSDDHAAERQWTSSESVEEAIISQQSYLDLTARARRALTSEQYHVLMMVADGWSTAEIARALDCSPKRVAAVLALARATMQKELQQDHETEDDID